jgi:ElaB/YqjD/DUF883 family membrane-anchored ribosome-binding protein
MEEPTMDTSEVVEQAADEVEQVADSAEEKASDVADAAAGATQRAREVVADVADSARSAVETHAPAVRDAAEQAVSAIQTHAPAVYEAGRSATSAAYEQVRKADDDQLAMGTAFAAGLVAGFVLARVPKPLLFLALVPLAVLGGTLLGRKGPFASKPKGRSKASSS